MKPTKDLRPPVGGKGKKKSTVLYEMKTYQMNRDKFASARKWCDDRNIIFDIWTEKHLRAERIIHSIIVYITYNPNSKQQSQHDNLKYLIEYLVYHFFSFNLLINVNATLLFLLTLVL